MAGRAVATLSSRGRIVPRREAKGEDACVHRREGRWRSSNTRSHESMWPWPTTRWRAWPSTRKRCRRACCASPAWRSHWARNSTRMWGSYVMTPEEYGTRVAELERRFPGCTEFVDAASECPHGRLPVETDAPCGCWPNRRLEQLSILEGWHGA